MKDKYLRELRYRISRKIQPTSDRRQFERGQEVSLMKL